MREAGGLILRNDSRTAYNRAYLATAIAFAQIQPDGWTSDTLGTLAIIITWMHGYPLLFLQK